MSFIVAAVVEATETFKLWKQAKANKEQQETQKEQKKPPPFRYIKVRHSQISPSPWDWPLHFEAGEDLAPRILNLGANKPFAYRTLVHCSGI